MKTLVFFVIITLALWVGGCKTDDQNARTLDFLERANARGHLNIKMTPTVGLSIRNDFILGPTETTIMFSGDIKFDEEVWVEVSEPVEVPPIR